MSQPNKGGGRIVDVTGQTFSMLRVLEFVGVVPHGDSGGAAAWRCVCLCGAERVVKGTDLRVGRVYSCGCKSRPTEHRRPRRRTPLDQRFWKFVDSSGGVDACWPWRGAINATGYGRLSPRDGSELAHRYAYRVRIAPIPDGLCLCHRCDNRKCVNPHHMFVGTRADNNRDMHGKGRGVRGERSGTATMTEATARAILAACGTGTEAKTVIARRFGVGIGAVHGIAHGRKWRHIQPV